jgi:uncharacterized DUF497 family protein
VDSLRSRSSRPGDAQRHALGTSARYTVTADARGPPTPRLVAYIRRRYTVVVPRIRFRWDLGKDAPNRAKHGVSFDEASSAFADENGVLVHDPDHSADEDRFVLLGLSSRLRLLVVVHCYRESESVIRIISARTADKRERGDYLSRNSP